MATQRTKFPVVVFICLGVFLFALGCILPSRTVYPASLEPVRSLTLTIDKSQREDLFAQLQNFADEHDFRLVTTTYEKTEHFLVELWGENILITASDDPGNLESVTIFFSGKSPGYSVDEKAVDELLNDLKSHINEIPNVTITEEK